MPITGQRAARRTLGRRLSRLREGSGRTRRAVAESRLGFSEPTLHRIETGKVPVTPANVRALCWLYGVDQSVTDALAELALATTREEWWEESPLIPDWYKLYVGLEASATQVTVYDTEVVPGLLQTEAYALAVFQALHPDDPDRPAREVRLRLQRQRSWFERVPPPNLRLIATEEVLLRPVGGADVLADQISHLQRMHKDYDTVDARILPLSAKAHPGITGAFRILDFRDDPSIVYLESRRGALYLEEADDVSDYRGLFDQLRALTVPIDKYASPIRQHTPSTAP